MQLDEQARRESYEAWEAMAEGWERARERIERTTTPVREWLLRELAPQPGDTVLELAAGPGETGFEAARLVGAEGRVISSDRSPAMVEVGRRRADELGVRNVELRVLDAEDLDLPDGSVDRVVCRFGYMLMHDPARALRETRRVLRPGGRLVCAVWREADRNPWVSVPARMFLARGHVPPHEPGTPGMFALASDERIRKVFSGTGLTPVKIEDVTVVFVAESLDAYITDARETGGLFSRVWDAVSDDERASMAAELAEAFSQFEVDGGYELPGLAVGIAAE